jgi:hypothetical protein
MQTGNYLLHLNNSPLLFNFQSPITNDYPRYLYIVKHLLALSFFLLSLSSAISQSIQWSAPLSDDKRMPYLKILGADDEGYFILRSNFSFLSDRDRSLFKSRKYDLQYYTDNLILKWSQTLTTENDNRKISDIILAGNKVTLLLSEYSKENKTLSLYAQQIDKSGKYSPPVLIHALRAEKIDDDNKPDIAISHDEHLLACVYRLMPKNKEEQTYQTIIFDSSLTVLYRKEIPVPISSKRFTPLNFVLTDAGNFFLLGVEFTTDKRVKAPGQSFYKLYSYNLKTESVTSNDIKVENKFLTDVGISADNLNHKIVLAGFYSDKTTYSTAGVFYYSLTEDNLKQTPVVTSSFSQDFLRKFAAERTARNSNELTNYSIDRIILRKDGGAAVVAESFYSTTRSYWDYYSQTFVTQYYYHYGNIMALSVNPDGSLLWSNAITKDQNSTNDGGYYSSYFSAIIGGKILSIYNKHVNSPGSVLMTNISGIGEQNTKVLFNDSENISVIPRSGKQVDENVLLLPASRETKPYLVKLSF